MRQFDLISMGRTILDVYGNQVGCGLEETSSFSKYVGGCPANIAIGTARLGLRVAHITRVGDDHHGRFLREQLSREGVDVSHVKTDPARLTGVAFLGIRDKDTFPLLHYRDNCADMAIGPDDYTREFIGSATALLVTGSHVTTTSAAANVDAAVAHAKATATRVIFDIDYRPVFWRLVAKDAGESRYVSSEAATAATQRVLPHADLVIGTEEEIRIAGGATDTREALARMRTLTSAPIVMKRGPQGCIIFEGDIPQDLDQGILGPGFPVEVFNVVGAGDGFLSGFLSGWLRDTTWQDCCRRGNACGALVVSRHGCSPASPTADELAWYLENAVNDVALHDNRALERVHRATTRRARRTPAVVIDCDDAALRTLLPRQGLKSLPRFAAIASRVVQRLNAKGKVVGLLVNGSGCDDALFALGSATEWVVRAIEAPGCKPLSFLLEKPAGVLLRNWPQHQIVKCALPAAEGPSALLQNERLRELQYAVEMWGHELLLMLDDGRHQAHNARDMAERIRALQALGVQPDWWGLPATVAKEEFELLRSAIAADNPWCRGVIITDRGTQGHTAKRCAEALAQSTLVKGFMVGRSTLGRALDDWIAARLSDADLENSIEQIVGALVAIRHGRA